MKKTFSPSSRCVKSSKSIKSSVSLSEDLEGAWYDTMDCLGIHTFMDEVYRYLSDDEIEDMIRFIRNNWDLDYRD